jgi:3',5'-cyclic-AMP phosphodiesterase
MGWFLKLARRQYLRFCAETSNSMTPTFEIEGRPFAALPYRNAISNGWSEIAFLPFHEARANWVPEGFDGLVLTADLQGIVEHPRTGLPELLGLGVVEKLVELHHEGAIPDPRRMAALLMGDFFAIPDKRGGFGCVADVWDAFADIFGTVAGVAGNHDDTSKLRRKANVLFLDTELQTLGNLRVGGVGKSIGNADKPGKRGEAEQMEHMKRVAEAKPDLWITHEGPEGGDGQPGIAWISHLAQANGLPVTLRGHKRWKQPVFQGRGGLVVNAHEKVIVVRRE